MKRFAEGSTVVCRHVYRGTPTAVVERIVIHDTYSSVALWFGPGCRFDVMSVARSKRVSALASGDWPMRSGVAGPDTDTLHVVPDGAAFGLEPQYGVDRRVRGWYVNLQEPLARTSAGFDTMDQQLDLLVDRDGGNLREKDRADLELMAELGLWSSEVLASIEHAAEAALNYIRADAASRWDNWHPPR
jgi:hypothetical protein